MEGRGEEMKKSNLYVGFAYLLVGIGCFVMLGLTHYLSLIHI